MANTLNSKSHGMMNISAFCNTNGGTLYMGIDDNGRTVGVDAPKKLIEKLLNFISQKTGITGND